MFFVLIPCRGAGGWVGGWGGDYVHGVHGNADYACSVFVLLPCFPAGVGATHGNNIALAVMRMLTMMMMMITMMTIMTTVLMITLMKMMMIMVVMRARMVMLIRMIMKTTAAVFTGSFEQQL